MILVKIYWNTEANGEPVPDDVGLDDMPLSLYGPFDTIDEAIDWMNNDYPDDDTDVHDMVADDYNVMRMDLQYVNSPDSIFGDHPDEDIRDDSQEIHVP